MKTFSYSVVFLLIILFIICNSGCHKSESLPDCGCGSDTIQTINEWKGYLFFNRTQKHYEIQIGVPGLFSNYFICDSTFRQLHSIIDVNRDSTYPVIFSGRVSTFCVPDSVAGYTEQMYNVKLINLTKQ
jgi:hypothetical protein